MDHLAVVDPGGQGVWVPLPLLKTSQKKMIGVLSVADLEICQGGHITCETCGRARQPSFI